MNRIEQQIRMRTPTIALVGLFVFPMFCAAQRPVAEPDLEVRKYSNGPLTIKDFRGPVPNPRPRLVSGQAEAQTMVDLRWQVKYDGVENDGDTVVRLTAIEVFAVVVQNQSWITNHRLLDHEQGHFDIAQSCALTTQLALTQNIRAGSPLSGRGKNRDEATADLANKIRKAMAPFKKQHDKDQSQYDRVTFHGLMPEEQLQERRNQKRSLDEVRAELKELSND